MTEDTASQLVAENLAQRREIEELLAERAALQAQLKQLNAALAAALKKTNQQVPSIVKASRPKPVGSRRPRKKRTAA